MYDTDEILVPLSELGKKLPYYSKIKPQLTVPSGIDMEVGIYSYSLVDKALMTKESKLKKRKRRSRKKRRKNKLSKEIRIKQHKRLKPLKQHEIAKLQTMLLSLMTDNVLD